MSAAAVGVESLPSLPVHTLNAAHTTSSVSQPEDEARRSQDFNRSASYTTLPGVSDVSPGLKRTFSDNVLSTLMQRPAKTTSLVQNANIELFRRASHKTKKRMSAARFVSANEIEESERTGRISEKADTATIKSLGRGAGALKKLSRKSWLTTAHPNPALAREGTKRGNGSSQPQGRVGGKSSAQGIAMPEPVATRLSPRASKGTGDKPVSASQERRAHRREDSSPSPNARSMGESANEAETDPSSRRLSRPSSYSSMRGRTLADRMRLGVPSAKVPPGSSSVSSDRSSSQSLGAGHKKDLHWGLFRSIEGEYISFQAKTSLQKAKVVRTVLLPFLAKTSDRIVTSSLRAEDLDRRVVILNKWWTGLLDLLHGSGQQSISGIDRPAFLEAICEIMFRAEWKTPPLQPCATESPDNHASIQKTDSNGSVGGGEPDFLLRSIHQNIRNMFVQNIIQQMAFVVDKLSMRSAPASLVVFGGKTCAYAFFYCPGVADILTRLWHIPPGTLRRIFAEYGPGSSRESAVLSQALASSFPAPLRSLSFTSHVALSKQLQNKAQVPPNTAHIRWYGPWVNRWTGRDSDLFYVFVKHYHLLVADHQPRRLLPDELMGVPGLVVVHAQMLMNLESALYRQAGHLAAEHYASASEGPDAMAPLPMIIPNATRQIGENRLVMLIRDSVGDRRPPENAALADFLVSSFQYILKAAVRKVSMYNNDACFVLCDFLEELMPLVSKYQRFHPEDEDWEFWFKVYQQLMRSESTMTQIRVIAFLYGTWPILVNSDERKRQVVLNWLLETSFFARYFNHWSPMVRHYFARLLCWRVGRSDGVASDVDRQVYQRLLQLLNRSWAHHQYLTADAEMRETSPPSTTPCAPAPGRILLIIRTDGHHQSDTFNSFDKLLPSGTNQSSPYTSHSSILSKVPEADIRQSVPKKRWSILKTIGIFNSPSNTKPGEVTPPGSPDSMKGHSSNNQPGSKTNGAVSRPSTPPLQTLTFRFTLEYTNTRPQLPTNDHRLPPPTLPHTSQKVLDDFERLGRLSSTEKLPIKEIKPLKPKPEELNTARYSGRALSEWAQVVQECRNFYARRRQEGCAKDSAIETPYIAVESFRMFG